MKDSFPAGRLSQPLTNSGKPGSDWISAPNSTAGEWSSSSCQERSPTTRFRFVAQDCFELGLRDRHDGTQATAATNRSACFTRSSPEINLGSSASLRATRVVTSAPRQRRAQRPSGRKRQNAGQPARVERPACNARIILLVHAAVRSFRSCSVLRTPGLLIARQAVGELCWDRWSRPQRLIPLSQVHQYLGAAGGLEGHPNPTPRPLHVAACDATIPHTELPGTTE